MSRDGKNNPVVDVSELIRVYGNVNIPEKQIPGISHRENTQKNFPQEQLLAMQKELADLRQAVTLMLEDKTSGKKNAASTMMSAGNPGRSGQIDNRTDTEEKRFWSGWFS
ncbi:hypothetical protein OVX87_32790 [Klebsiella pneumoniae]|nr:hypothetical protein [Klebsiella pneumoniae]